MKNLLHKTLCGLLITLCVQAGAFTLHPLQPAGAIVLPGPSLSVVSIQTYLLQPIENSSVKAAAATNTLNLSKDKRVKAVFFSECEIGELGMSSVVRCRSVNQRLSILVSQKTNACLPGEGGRGMIDLKLAQSTPKYLMRDDDSKNAVNISHYNDRTILYAKVVC